MQQFLECVASNVALSAALALIAVALTRVWRSPQLAHALWLLVLLKLISPPLMAVPIAISGAMSFSERVPSAESSGDAREQWSPEIDGAPAVETALLDRLPALDEQLDALIMQAMMDAAPATPAPEPIVERPLSQFQRITNRLAVLPWPWTLCAVWGAGVFIGTTILVRRISQFRTLLAGARDADPALVDEVRGLANLLGLRHCPSIRVVDAHLPPLVCAAWRRPLLILPETLLHALDREQLEAVLVHELAHIRRGDHLVRWFEIVVCGLWWWNPLAWWAARQLRRAEEECCDAWVVWTLPHARQSYGKALLQTVDFLLERRAVPAIARTAFGGPHIKRRIEMIVKRKLNRKMSTAALLTVIVSAVCVLPVSAQKRTETAAAAPEAAENVAGQGAAVQPVAEQEATVQALNQKLKQLIGEPVAEATSSVAQSPPAAANGDLEARISRLEQALQELIQTVKSKPSDRFEGKPAKTEHKLGANVVDMAGRLVDVKSATPNKPETAPADDDEYITKVVPYRTARVVYETHEKTVRVRKADFEKNVDANRKKALLALDQKRWDAAAKQDPSVAEQILADDYVGMYVNASGYGTSNKASSVAAAGRRKYTEVNRRDAECRRINDDTVILTYVYDCKVQEGDNVETYRDHQVTQLWTRVKNDPEGRWVIRFTQDFIRPGGQ